MRRLAFRLYMRLEKIRHGGVGALRGGRFREHCGESVGERFRLVHVEKLGLPTVFLQCRGKIAAVMAEKVTARRHEEAGRERGDQRRIFGVDVFPERRMPPTAAIDHVREENADVVKAGRIQYKYDLPGAC